MLKGKKHDFQKNDFYGKLAEIIREKPYGIQFAREVMQIVSNFWKEKGESVTFYTSNEKEVVAFSTLPQDEAAFYRNACAGVSRHSGEIVQIHTKNSALEGNWVLELYETMSEEDKSEYWKIVEIAGGVVCACLLAAELEIASERDVVTGFLCNASFERALKKCLSERENGYLIVAKTVIDYAKPYKENGLNASIRDLASVCAACAGHAVEGEKMDTYRIGEDVIAILCRERQEKAYATAQEIAKKNGADLFIISFSSVNGADIYSMIQKNFDRKEERRGAFGICYPYPALPVYRDSGEGERNVLEET